MINKMEYENLWNSLMNKIHADKAECVVRYEEENLSRFANSAIHQNVSSKNTRIHLRLIQGKHSGFASTNDLSPEGLDRLVKSSQTILKNSKEDRESYDLPHPETIDPIAFPCYDESNELDRPDARAEIVQKLCEGAIKNQVSAFGSVATHRRSLYIANTHGVSAFHPSTHAQASCQMMKESASGYAQSSSTFFNQLETDRVLEDALWGCLNSQNAKSLEAKAYEVILKPEAVEDIINMLVYMGFSTNAIMENRSFLSERKDELIFDPKLSIRDNCRDLRQLPLPFDFEGAPKKTVTMIEKGIFKNMVTDAKWASKLKCPNTGHALPAPNPWGPIPIHIVLEGEQAQSIEQMIQNCQEGLLITRFWYANPSHPKKAIATGLTRDGTFYVRNGKIQHAVHNLRYTDSLIKVLSKVISTGDTYRRLDHTVAPALHCSSMEFTGQAAK